MEFVLSFFGNSEFFFEISKGNVPKHSVVNITGANDDVDTAAPEVITDLGDAFIQATTGEQLEVASTSANDTSAGTGARTVKLTYLDDAWAEQEETITMNGLTPVQTVATDIYRVRELEVITSGTSLENEGEITVNTVGSGNPKLLMKTGFARTFHGLYTVPEGKTAYVTWAYGTVQKGKDCKVAVNVSEADDNLFRLRLPFDLYQNTVVLEPTCPFGPYSARTDFEPTAQTENNNTEIAVTYQVILVDD